jgi:hypothetical protein
MRHMNYKIQTLLQEGVSISTLENLTSDQINVLYERAKKSKKIETKEQDAPKPIERTVTSRVKELPSGASVTVGDSKIENKGGKTIVTTTQEGEVTERSVSKQQQKLMGLALSVKKGDTPKSKVSKKVQDMSKDMSKKDLKDFASTKHKGLPKKKKSETKETVKNLEESIMKLIENHLPPTTTKSELLNSIKKFKR